MLKTGEAGNVYASATTGYWLPGGVVGGDLGWSLGSHHLNVFLVQGGGERERGNHLS